MSENLQMLPLPMITATCKLGGGAEQCRYLAHREDNNKFFVCTKIVPHVKELIDKEFEAYNRRYAETSKQHDLPVGDNCPGFAQVLEGT